MAGGCGELPSKKENGRSTCPESKQDKKDRNKSRSTEKDAFGRKVCTQKEDEKNEIECHESRKKFFEKKDDKSKNNKYENQQEEREEEYYVNNTFPSSTCEVASKKAKKNYKCKEDTSKTNCCSSASKGKSSNPCGKIVGSSKKSGSCKHYGKQYVESGSKPKPCSTVDKDESLEMPEPQVMTMRPCLPRVEKGISAKRRKKVACVTTEISCPQLKKPSMVEFFCIDARNKRMNECIKQYMKSDPTQVNIQCSQFARKRMHTVTQQSTVNSQQSPASAGFLPPKYRQIVRRWLPAAGLYVVATAAVAAWVTEWEEVVKRIPYYKVQEEVSLAKPPSESSEPPESPASSLESSPSTSESSSPETETPATTSGPQS